MTAVVKQGHSKMKPKKVLADEAQSKEKKRQRVKIGQFSRSVCGWFLIGKFFMMEM